MPLLLLIVFLSLFCQTVQAQNFANPYISEVSFYDCGSLSGSADLAIDLEKGSCGFKD